MGVQVEKKRMIRRSEWNTKVMVARVQDNYRKKMNIHTQYCELA